MDDDLELELLTALFILWYGTMHRAIHSAALVWLGLAPTELDTPSIRRTVLHARSRAASVDETTRKAIDDRINAGIARGLSPRQIALGTPDFDGITQLFENTWASRPELIGTTEMQHAALASTANRFQQLAGPRLVGWFASDGDYDARCAARNGRTFPPNDPPQLFHPNCRLVISPIIR